MKTVTLTSLRAQSRQRADMENSTFISDSELDGYINASAAELYDLIIGVYEDYKLTSANLSILPSTDTYSLPATFYKLRGVDLVLDAIGNAISLSPYVFAERNSYRFSPTWNVASGLQPLYHMQGDSIRFVPVPSGSATVKVWFIPAITTLVSGSDTLDGVNGFEEYVVIDAAIKMRTKEETDVQELERQKALMMNRINSMAANRDAGSPERVSDVTRALSWEYWSFSDGN